MDATGETLRLGALVSHQEIADHPVVRERLTALADASAIVGSHATRAQGTIGGNVMNASPAMETGGPLICFDATVTLHGASGVRRVAVDDLFTGPGRTTAQADELLTAVDVPIPAAGTGSCYARLEYRQQMEIAVVGATAVVTVADGTITAARIAITALAPTIRRVPAAEAALVGTDGGEAAAAAAAAGRRCRRRADLRCARLGGVPPRHGHRDRPPRRSRQPFGAPAASASPSLPARPCTEVSRESRNDAHRQRHRLRRRARAGHEPALRRPGRGGTDRIEGGLRRLRVRGLHDAASTASR